MPSESVSLGRTLPGLIVGEEGRIALFMVRGSRLATSAQPTHKGRLEIAVHDDRGLSTLRAPFVSFVPSW